MPLITKGKASLDNALYSGQNSLLFIFHIRLSYIKKYLKVNDHHFRRTQTCAAWIHHMDRHPGHKWENDFCFVCWLAAAASICWKYNHYRKDLEQAYFLGQVMKQKLQVYLYKFSPLTKLWRWFNTYEPKKNTHMEEVIMSWKQVIFEPQKAPQTQNFFTVQFSVFYGLCSRKINLEMKIIMKDNLRCCKEVIICHCEVLKEHQKHVDFQEF